ncbi:ABC transporter ATP-binding protein [Streptococcus equi]|uniref:ABC transporter ATP-binding protein n=1 Tax=Streptococcus equi subsp. ruminatorum TaxID=254358 RepID=A0A6M1KXJ6_9STRE|nr:ABC transporter ATP-binding protein [Streptococcus equi]NGL83965.1 ABC transporter ATP-binding protein [Streptococcus equi subsp. ruminatorum]
MSTISAERISAGYDQSLIISDLSVTIPEGKVTTIIGANGCGKSTLLKALARLLPLKAGQVLLDGQAIARLATKDLAKTLALLPQLQEATAATVYELVSYGRYPHQSYLGRLSQADKDKICWAMEVTSMTPYAHQTVDALSGGQRQRAWIAMALAQDTDIIFLDEPTTYLDMNHQLDILELLKELNQVSGKTIVMVLHDLNLSARYSDHLIAMKNGHIKYSGEVNQVMTPEMIQDIFQVKAQLVTDPLYNCPTLLTYQLI